MIYLWNYVPLTNYIYNLIRQIHNTPSHNEIKQETLTFRNNDDGVRVRQRNTNWTIYRNNPARRVWNEFIIAKTNDPFGIVVCQFTCHAFIICLLAIADQKNLIGVGKWQILAQTWPLTWPARSLSCHHERIVFPKLDSKFCNFACLAQPTTQFASNSHRRRLTHVCVLSA